MVLGRYLMAEYLDPEGYEHISSSRECSRLPGGSPSVR